MTREEMNHALMRVRSGEMAFDAFSRMSMTRWLALATSLLRRWDAPSWVTSEDVLQDLLFAAWRSVKRWKPDHDSTIEEYVFWNATDKAKKSIHKARLGKRPHRDEDFTASRYDRPFSTFVRPGEDDDARAVVEDRVSVPAEQGDAMDLRRAFERARAHVVDMAEDIAVQALAATAGDVEAAASAILASPEARLFARVGSERKAVLIVTRAATRVVGRMIMDEQESAA
jgi:DNA-directed RNA polymerase specialized sigma24 family protein